MLAKYFITLQIEKKLKELNQPMQNSAKIIIVKKASDHLVTSQLAKLAMMDSLPTSGSVEQKDGSEVQVRIIRKVLKGTKTRLGGKLSHLLKIFSLGQKLTTGDN